MISSFVFCFQTKPTQPTFLKKKNIFESLRWNSRYFQHLNCFNFLKLKKTVEQSLTSTGNKCVRVFLTPTPLNTLLSATYRNWNNLPGLLGICFKRVKVFNKVFRKEVHGSNFAVKDLFCKRLKAQHCTEGVGSL